MKKGIILCILLFGSFLSLWAQQNVTIANGTKNTIVINGTTIRSKNVKQVSLPVTSDQVTFDVIYYEGLEKRGPVTLTRSVDKGRLTIRDFESGETARGSSISRRDDASNKATFGTPPAVVNTNLNASLSMSDNLISGTTVSVQPRNKLKNQSLFVPTPPFKGLALKPEQKSERVTTLNTGKIVFPVLLASEDSLNSEFSWALVNKIVTEGQVEFDIFPEDIKTANSGDIIRKTILSKLPSPFIISDGKARGTVVTPDSPTRLELYVGWNIVPIQYQDPNGFPTEAILILLVDNKPRPLLAREKNQNDIIKVVPGNVVVTSMGR